MRAGEPVRFQRYVPRVARWADVRAIPYDGGVTLVATELTSSASESDWFRLLAVTVEESMQAVVIADAQAPGYPIVYVNKGFTDLTGYTQAEALGRDVRFLREDEPEQPAAEAVWNELLAGRPGRGVLKYRTQSGAPFWGDLCAIPIPDEDGTVSHILGMALDVTERVAEDQATRERAVVLRTLSRRLVEAQEAERRALALDLHDEIGQSLTALNLTLQTAEADPPRAPALAAEAGAVVRGLQAYVRDLAFQLRPAMIDDLGLFPALEWLTGWAEEHLGLDVEVDVPGVGADLDPEVALAAYRIVQEALTNAAKYAGTAEVRVSVEARGGSLEVRVEDEGVGFDPDAVEAGAGLSGIAERAGAIGGEASVRSRPGAGTLVQARLPLWGDCPSSNGLVR